MVCAYLASDKRIRYTALTPPISHSVNRHYIETLYYYYYYYYYYTTTASLFY